MNAAGSVNGKHTGSLVTVSPDRAAHWIRLNHQERMPKRWIAFDTEAKAERYDGGERQQWAMGAAIRWRNDLKTGDHAEARTFNSPESLWEWVADYCRPEQRTVAIAHNLGYDVRISGALDILPRLGFRLEWCNLDSNVSSMTWRSDRGTLVFMDTWTWLPMDLRTIGLDIGLPKLEMPPDNAHHYRWERYCMRDAEIVYRIVTDINAYIRSQHLGNWQPTGAGMAYATWRHKFMHHKILVHDDIEVLTAERLAMHTGRAEAWRHGQQPPGVWTEVDMRNAYLMIAAECDMPVKLKMKVGAISNAQYDKLSTIYRILARVRISTAHPVVPYNAGTKTVWPTGTFDTWLWDTEIAEARADGATVRITDALLYTKGPILSEWAKWVLSILRDPSERVSPVVRTWLKHCSRAFIGRLSLRYPSWEYFGENPGGLTGISHETNAETGRTCRMLHIGNQTFRETDRTEGRDSLPQVTGWIMAECRARLWRAMRVAGVDHVGHVDTDSLLVDRAGLARLREQLGAAFGTHWQVKGSTGRLIVYGPRNYRMGRRRKASGVPKRAEEILPNQFKGERWHGVALDLESGYPACVTIETATWNLTKNDPRRVDAPGAVGRTMAIQLAEGVSLSVSSSSTLGSGS